MSTIFQRLRRAALLRDGGGLTDGQLLGSFIDNRDEAGFEVLVRRHGPMVLGVCRRLLGNADDAEDAFQATFLVLVRKARLVVPRERVGNWLYGVAYRTALEARARNSRRRAKERQVEDMPRPHSEPEPAWHELQPLLDRELSRLPEKYRLPVVLCELEGRSRKQVARQLNLPEGTLSSRLATARKMLAKRLTRRGLAFSAATLAMVLSQNAAAASAPAPLVLSTVKAATLIAAGQAAAGVISAQVAALTEGVLKAMFLTKLKIATVVLVGIGILGSGAALLTHHALAQKPVANAAKADGGSEATEVMGVLHVVDAAKNTITIHSSKAFSGVGTFDLAMNVKIFLDDGTGGKLGFQEGKLTDLSEGAVVTLRLGEQKVVRIWADGPTVQGLLKAVDPVNNTITVTLALAKGEAAADKTFIVAKNVALAIDDGKAKDKSKPAKRLILAELPLNAAVSLKMSVDQKVVGGIRAEGQTLTGMVKAVDAAKDTLTLTVVAKGEASLERTLIVAKDASVEIDIGKTKDKKTKVKPPPASLADVPTGALVSVRLSLDQQSIVTIRAEGSSTQGTVQGVDAEKNTITLHAKKEGEKTYTVLKDAVAYFEGQDKGKKLVDVPVEGIVNLKLLADQKTVWEICVQGPTVQGALKGAPTNDSITIGNKGGDQIFVVKDVPLVIEDKKDGKLADLIDGTVVKLRLSPDKSAILEFHAEGPSFQGTVKALDIDKNSITLTMGGKKGGIGEDRDFKLAKDTVVVTQINAAALKLTDLKVDKQVVLRLGIDQKAAARVTVLGE